MKKYIQYGCGDCAPREWLNFDASPTVRILNIPLVGDLLRRKIKSNFPRNVVYGNIVYGLPVPHNSCDGVYASHVLEHLTLEDFRTSVLNTHKILKPGGIFRCIVPDLAKCAQLYLDRFQNGEVDASMTFLAYDAVIGLQSRPRGLKGFISTIFSNAHHLWMWDALSLRKELEDAGFTAIRQCQYHDSEDEMFKYVEDKRRFNNAVAFQCMK